MTTKDDTMGNLSTYLNPYNYGHDHNDSGRRPKCRLCNDAGRRLLGWSETGVPVDELCSCYQGPKEIGRG
jgi:hypothetical protein